MRRLLRHRAVALSAIVVIGLASASARCIENTSVQKDGAGYSHIFGEMINETDIQGQGLVVHGRLLDGAGVPIAEAQGTTCPPDLQPHSQVMYDIRFPAPVAQEPASHDARPAAGKALPAPLEDPRVIVVQPGAVRFEDGVFVLMGVINAYEREHTRLEGCIAIYDGAGKVIAGGHSDVVSIDEDGDIDFSPSLRVNEPGVLGVAVFEGVPAAARTARGWIWFDAPNAPGTSQFQYIMTDQVQIMEGGLVPP